MNNQQSQITEVFRKIADKKKEETKQENNYQEPVQELNISKDDKVKPNTLYKNIGKKIIEGVFVFYIITAIISCMIAPMLNVEMQQKIYNSALLNRSSHVGYVDMVKEIKPFNTKDVGTLFDDFFGEPKWKYIRESQDITPGKSTMMDIVEFTGKCTMNNIEANAMLKFTVVNGTADFSTVRAYINNEKLNNGDTNSFIDSIYKDELNAVMNKQITNK